MIYPPPLPPGTRVRIPAPASPVREPFLRQGLEALRRQGLLPFHSPSVFDRHFYSAGTDESRAGDLAAALVDPDAGAVWFARGGYGSGRLLPALDRAFPDPPRVPKAIIGCSDTTFLLLYFLQRWEWVVFHGPMAAGDMGRDESACDRDYLFALLRKAPVRAAVSPEPLEVVADGPAVRAPLTGGCLSILAATLGTPYEWETDGQVLFLEDADEKPYRIDRMLVQLRQAGKFDRCAGIVFGQMPGCLQHAGQEYTLTEAIRWSLAGLPCAVLAGLASGHCASPSLPLALGAHYRLDPTRRNLFLEDELLCPSL